MHAKSIRNCEFLPLGLASARARGKGMAWETEKSFSGFQRCTHFVRRTYLIRKITIFCAKKSIQWVPQLFEQLEFFHVNKSGKIECCGNKMHQIIQNVILPRGLELKLSMLWRTTISGQHPLFYRREKVHEPLLPLKYNASRVLHTFSHHTENILIGQNV